MQYFYWRLIIKKVLETDAAIQNEKKQRLLQRGNPTWSGSPEGNGLQKADYKTGGLLKYDEQISKIESSFKRMPCW